MIPPKGFKAMLNPLRHKFAYSVGLSTVGVLNSTIITLVKNYKPVNNPNLVIVNPHAAGFDVETGAICGPMSIVDRLKLSMTFSMTKEATDDSMDAVKVQWMPIFGSFAEKYEAADDKTGTSVAALLELTKAGTEEDITPAFASKLTVVGSSDLLHPVTTVNFTEVFGTLNLTTDTKMEAVPWDSDTFFSALKYYTNKGALAACVGKMRTITLTKNRPVAKVFINKFVPRPVRRIVPYSYFGILLHVPDETNPAQYYMSTDATSGLGQVGVKALISFDEWNIDHNQEMVAA